MAEEFTCPVDEIYRSACKDLSKYSGSWFCVLHEPGEAKKEDFLKEKKSKLDRKDYDFGGTIFPEGASDFEGREFDADTKFAGATFRGTVDFSNATFKGDAYFSEATFEGDADFTGATFEGDAFFYKDTFKEGADFSDATFEGSTYFFEVTFKKWAGFWRATFEEEAANFRNATFGEGANFSNATFKGDAYFSEATFEGSTYLDNAIFKEGAIFRSLRTSSQTYLGFASAVIEKPERLSFHSTHLRPSWFIDVDAQKFDFSDVEWFRLPHGDELKLEKEIEALEASGQEATLGSLRKLQKACRKLMDNAEENRDYATANEFHYWSMELLRKQGLRELGLIGTLYWLLSGYGDRPRRAFLVLVEMWILFAILYMVWGHRDLQVDLLQVAVQALSGADIRQGIEHAWKALVYSLAAIARLNPEPKPSAPGVFQLLVTAEGLLGPLQIALLALAIRRKVMR